MLIINKLYRPSYTRRDLIENKYPNELGAIECVFKVFSEIQTVLVEVLFEYRDKLPSQIDEFDSVKDYNKFSQYIYYFSLYSFLEKAAEILSRHCTSLADAINEADADAEETALDKLRLTRAALCEIPFDNILDTQVNNMFTLKRYADMCEKGVDFQVLNSWSFRDILRNLNSDSRKFRGLYLDTINQEIPSASTIGNVVDSDEMIRIY